MTGEGTESRHKWLAFTAVSVGVFMSTLDASIVNIGLPTIGASFHSKLATVQWVVMAYLLAITSVLLSIGRLGDMVGRKRVYQTGVIVFTLGSVLCGISPTITMLIFARALQGVGASMIMSMGPAIITSAFPPNERGRALGLNGTVVAIGLSFGPAIGGYIINYLGWRWMFFVNIPIGIIGAPLISFLLKESGRGRREKFDIPGAVMLFLSLISVLLALSYGEEWRWTSVRTLSLFSGFAVFGTLFLLWERRVASPIFHLELFKNWAFTSASMTAWISYVALFAVSVYMPFYLEQVLKLSDITTGQILMIVPATVMFIAPVSGWLSDRIGSRVPASIGLAVATCGLVALSGLGTGEPVWNVAWRLLLIGLGSGMFQSPNSSSIMGSVSRNMLGVASGTVAMMRNLGMVSGVAIVGAVVSAKQAGYLEMSDTGDPSMAMVTGLHYGFLVAASICAAGVVVSAMRGSVPKQDGDAETRGRGDGETIRK